MADGAVGDDDRGVDAVGLAAGEEFGGVGFDGDAVRAVGGRAEEAGADCADAPGGGGAQEGGEGEPGVLVGRGGVFAVVADMGDAGVGRFGGGLAVDLIEFGAAVVGRAGPLVAFVGLEGGGGGDDGDAGVGEGFGKRGEGGCEVVGPAVGRGVADGGVVGAGAGHIGDGGVVVGGETHGGVDVIGHGGAPDVRGGSFGGV